MILCRTMFLTVQGHMFLDWIWGWCVSCVCGPFPLSCCLLLICFNKTFCNNFVLNMVSGINFFNLLFDLRFFLVIIFFKWRFYFIFFLLKGNHFKFYFKTDLWPTETKSNAYTTELGVLFYFYIKIGPGLDQWVKALGNKNEKKVLILSG